MGIISVEISYPNYDIWVDSKSHQAIHFQNLKSQDGL